MSTPDEFDDVTRNGPYVASPKARAEMKRLAAEHGLSYTHNAGGGEFYREGWRCQITTNDDLADLNKLRTALGVPPL